MTPRGSLRAGALLALAGSLACGPGAVAHHLVPGPDGRAPVHGVYGVEQEIHPTRLEARVAEALARRAARPPHLSAALSAAARELARGDAAGVADPISPWRVRAALVHASAYDPAPVARLVVATPDATVALATAPAQDAPAPTHVGVGAVEVDGHAHAVLLLARRTAALRPFPREVVPGTTASLAGELLGLTRPTVHVTAPSGASRTVETRVRGLAFSGPVTFDSAGRWRVEVVGDGPRGPEVAALLTVRCGAAPPEEPAPPADPPDPADPRAAEARVVSAVNATRELQGLPPLQDSPALAEVARRHSAAMLAAGALAHRLPGSGDAGERLRRSRVPFARVLENVAKGPSALAAHHLAEESPAHRQNLLSRAARQIGVGIARGTLEGGEPIVYLTELMVEPVQGEGGGGPAPEAGVRAALEEARARAGSPPLIRDPVLDGLARGAVADMLREDDPTPGDLASRALDAGRSVAAADAFVAARPAAVTRSHNVTDPRFHRFGVAVAVGDSARLGDGLLWIAVVYTD